MDDIDSPPASANPRKRPAAAEDAVENKPLNLKGTQFAMPTPPDTDQSSNASPSCNNHPSARAASPAPSSTTLSSIETFGELGSNDQAQSSSNVVDLTTSAVGGSTSGPPPKKRRKLTFAEKEEQKREKEAKAAEKAAEKARKDEEKAVEKARKDEEKAKRDEEKRVRDEEKRRKAEEREAEKRAKEVKEEQKQQEKMKKERSQMRLGAFFQKPGTPAKESGPDADGEVSYSATARRKSLSLEPFDAVKDQIRGSESPCKEVPQRVLPEKSPLKPLVSDYKKYFLPFQLQTHTSMSTIHLRDQSDTAQDAFDHELNDPSIREKYDLGLVESYASLDRQFKSERNTVRGLQLPPVRHLADQLLGAPQQPIDLTDDNEEPSNPLDTLRAIPRRHIEFSEDVRPAYFGSYTKIRSPISSRKLSRDPFRRARPDTDYDYDSEAEWEEPEEGEELLDEDDDEAESQGDANEMDEFLDDEDDALKNRRKLIAGDLVPSCTGICWEDECGRVVGSVEGGSPVRGLRDMRIGVLLPEFRGKTIDPYSTAYWESDPTPVPSTIVVKSEQPSQEPDASITSRPPLQTLPSSNSVPQQSMNATNTLATQSTLPGATIPQKPSTKTQPKALSKEDFDEFKTFVVGSTASKGDLLKELKTRFPKLTNDTIKATLSDNFAQVGASKAEKKWGVVSVG